MEIIQENEKNMFLHEVPVLGPEEWMGKDGRQPIISLTVISRQVLQQILQENKIYDKKIKDWGKNFSDYIINQCC